MSTSDQDAWREFCGRLGALADVIAGDEYPGDARARAEGFRYLSRMAVFATQWFVEFSDPEFPAFYRFDDDVVKWGAPNADNQYLRAKVDGSGAYRVTADVTGVREMLLSTQEGDMQLGQFRVFDERALSNLAVEPDGSLELFVGGPERAGNWMPLHPDTDHLLVRQYVSDWEHDAVARMHIERLGNEGRAPEPPNIAQLARAYDQAANWIERSVPYWNDYTRRSRAGGTDNELSPPRSPKGGAHNILYGGGWWNLDPGEALLVTCDAPAANYWSFQGYSAGWFESLDFANRTTSLNGHQIRVDDDGRFRLAISHADPGIENGLDTAGHHAGMVTYRWVLTETQPAPSTEVVPLASVVDRVAGTTPAFDASRRAEQIRRRRVAVAKRFRV
jgi:hypothetical protein